MTGTKTVGQIMAESGVAFGTSGARGLVAAMTDRVCHAYTVGFLRYLVQQGEFSVGGKVAIAGDLRPSTPRIMAACAQAVRDLGGEPLNLGLIPTPALAYFAFAERIPSLMVTGSHIPEDRNGIKFYRPQGEVLKTDEAGMMAQDVDVSGTSFDSHGMLAPLPALPPVRDVTDLYIKRYVDAFGATALVGRRLGVYQHSAVGRDLLVTLLHALGAEVTPLMPSDSFVSVDTEAVRDEDIVLAGKWGATGRFDAILSTDGDSDRPLLADERGEWIRGDVLGVICARYLRVDCVVTPVSSNTVVERCGAFRTVARTRIGSPYVIARMLELQESGEGLVCGYEANGGFLLGNDLNLAGGRLSALPTRDAVLPMIAALVATGEGKLSSLVASLPARFTHSDRIAGIPTDQSRALLEQLATGTEEGRMDAIEELFGPIAGKPQAVDQTDGLRITFDNGSVIHLRPSGNAPELRCYTEALNPESALTQNRRALNACLQDLGSEKG